MEKWSFIVDLPIKHGDFPYFFVCLPEGICSNCGRWDSHELQKFPISSNKPKKTRRDINVNTQCHKPPIYPLVN